MKLRVLLPLTFAVTALLWSIVTWPLPARVGDAIPYTSQNRQRFEPRAMIAGDQLQLLYRFWLLGDMLKGHSPIGRNIYEFNRGDDDERRLPGAYYLPFSLVHVAVGEVLGTAFGWNFTGFLSLWLTYVFTILVLQFYTRDYRLAFVFAAVAILSPYRYWALLGGSPTGFAMLWPPVVVFGLEWALRKGRTAGGLVAGGALFLCCISDLQLFLFVFLLAVCWGAALFLHRCLTERRVLMVALTEGLRALWPVAAALVLCYAYSRHLTRMIGVSTHMADGRSMSEVALFSPTFKMLFSTDMSLDNHGAYAGYAWIALGLLGGAVSLHAAFTRKGTWRAVAIAAAWAMGLIVLYTLALGANTPGDGMALILARMVIPPLRMVRAPSRFLALTPTLIAVMLCVVAAPALARMKRRTVLVLLCVFAAAMTFEYARCTRVGLAVLDTHQAAYAAAKADHAGRADAPVRAMALPLWPGDSHWSSLYQYHASLHRVRMLNGYSPVVEHNYYEQIFERFNSMNAGVIDDDQLDALLAMDVRYVLFYEDAFPEIVSPFPAAHTLSRLGAHPRLAYLARGGRVWAFRIQETPDPDAVRPLLDSPVKFPTRFYDVQRTRRNAAARLSDASAVGASAALLDEAHPQLHVARTSMLGGEEIVWLARVRGQGAFRIGVQGNGVDWQSAAHTVAEDTWHWVAVSNAGIPAYAVGEVDIAWLSGRIEVDYVCLTTLRAPMGPCTLAAASFFRAGEADDADGSVRLDPVRDMRGRIFYGPRLPFEAGRYRVVLEYATDAPEGVLLGSWAIEQPTRHAVDVRAGATQAVLDLDLRENLPVEFAFDFAATYPVILRAVRVERAPAAITNLEDAHE